ncbi:hypothetical protein QL996_02500 [Planococcus sp. APC 4015]|nr:hypothetical protein [Planococcus sp. APC 4015]
MTRVSERTAGRAAVHLVDVLVYLVVLGLFVQFLPAVISESFAVSLATAVLLKLVLEVVVAAKNAVVARLRAAKRRVGRIIGVAALVAVSAGSKFVVLWLTDAVFGDAVHLGGFFSVTLLVVTLIVARALVRRVVDPRGSADLVA